jgi:hypothetical protein
VSDIFNVTVIQEGSLLVTIEESAPVNLNIDPAGTVFNVEISSIGLQGPRGVQGVPGDTGPIGPQGIQGPVGPQGPTGAIEESFESVSKNLKAYPCVYNYTLGVLTSIVYDLGSGQSITKTLGYVTGRLETITLSGNTPSGITLVKTLLYTGADLTGVTYS